MLKKGKKTHQSPSSKTKADEERKKLVKILLYFIYLFIFWDYEYRGLEFWGW